MLTIRLQRVGRKNDPSFRMVVVDSKRSTKSGNFLEVLGSHDARQKDKTVLKTDRIKHWLSVGAKLSDTAHNLLVKKQIITGNKINVAPRPATPAPSAEAPAQAEVVESSPASEAAPVEETPAEVVAEEAPATEASEEETKEDKAE